MVSGHRPLRLDRLKAQYAQADAAAILGEILSEADALIRLRPKEQGLELPHLVVGATPDNQIVVKAKAERLGVHGHDCVPAWEWRALQRR